MVDYSQWGNKGGAPFKRGRARRTCREYEKNIGRGVRGQGKWNAGTGGCTAQNTAELSHDPKLRLGTYGVGSFTD